MLPGLSGLALAGLPLLIAAPARAIIVTVGGSAWDVQTFTGSYTSESSKFNQSMMPWWNDQSLAGQFAAAVQNSLGTPNPPVGPLKNLGPYFAIETFVSGSNTVTGGSVWDQPPVGSGTLLNCTSTTTLCTTGLTDVGQSAVYATATATRNGPGPLPVLGALASFGWSRRLRRRLAS